MKSKIKTRKPTHPGVILEEHYIKPLNLNLDELSEKLEIARNTLYKIRKGRARVTPEIAVRLSQAFSTSVELWLNLQQKYDLWVIFNDKNLPTIPQIYPPKEPKKIRKNLNA